MSRRITFCVLAATATLIATQAVADRECFENSCRLPSVAEAPAPQAPKAAAATAAAADANAKSDHRSDHKSDQATAKAPATAAQPPVGAPAGVRPQVVASPAKSVPLQPLPRDAAHADAQNALARQPAQRHNVEPIAGQMTGTVGVTNWPARAHVVRRHSARGGRVVVAVPGTIYPDGNVVPSYPYLQPDPSWQLCQVDEGRRRHRSYDCGPYSYHPYGVYGHRPNGTYGGYRRTPAYVLAPNAKIITIEPAD
jgi:hypothetical protein